MINSLNGYTLEKPAKWIEFVCGSIREKNQRLRDVEKKRVERKMSILVEQIAWQELGCLLLAPQLVFCRGWGIYSLWTIDDSLFDLKIFLFGDYSMLEEDGW